MKQDVLRSYHEELVDRLRDYCKNVEYGHATYLALVGEVERAFSAARDQNRTPHQPLQPVDNV